MKELSQKIVKYGLLSLIIIFVLFLLFASYHLVTSLSYGSTSDEGIQIVLTTLFTIIFLVYAYVQFIRQNKFWNNVTRAFFCLVAILFIILFSYKIKYSLYLVSIYGHGRSTFEIILIILVFIALLLQAIISLIKKLSAIDTLKLFWRIILGYIAGFMVLIFGHLFFRGISSLFDKHNPVRFGLELFILLFVLVIPVIFIYFAILLFLHIFRKSSPDNKSKFSFKELIIKNRFILLIGALLLPLGVVSTAGAEGYDGLMIVFAISIIIGIILLTFGICGIILHKKSKITEK